jgi:hypothetical protein
LISSIDDPDCGDLDPNASIAIPNSNAFIDFDGDCLADLFLTLANGSSTYYAVFIQRLVETPQSDGTSVFVQKYCMSGTKGAIVNDGESLPLIELVDFNRDSMLDLAFYSPDGTITVLYNQYKAQAYNALPKFTTTQSKFHKASNCKEFRTPQTVL